MTELDDAWRGRVVSPADAVASIRPGSRIFVGSACATPRTLLGALAAREDRPAGIELIHYLTDGAGVAGAGDVADSFRHRTWFVGADMRDLAQRGRVDYAPIAMTEVPDLLAAHRLVLDEAFVQVAPPDADGHCSLGVSVDVTRAAALAAKRIVAEVNPAMPRTGPESSIPLDRIDRIVLVDEPVIEYRHPPVGEAAAQIARYVARLIDDGATLQVGLGRVPDEMLRHLTERRGLRVHSDVITDAVVDLIDRGVVDPPLVASMAMGTRRLYDHLDGNPDATLAPIEVVADADRLAALPGLATVTQAFAIDLAGAVCTETRDGVRYGGLGSQPAFHRAATRSPGGKPIVCLASTADDGSSSIRPSLRSDEPVAITRAEARWVITEYGSAYLHGRTLAERAVALIEIAHPDHRDALLSDAIAAGTVPAGQTLRSRAAYPVGDAEDVPLRDGRSVHVRPTRAGDAPLLQDLFFRMRDEDIRTRFFRRLRSLTDEMAQHLCSVSYESEMAYAAVVGEREAERVVGTACYYADASTGVADIAFMVDPGWQGSGLGSHLQDRMIRHARSRNLRGFSADVLAENAPMLRVFKRSGLRMESTLDSGAFEVRLWFD